MDRTLDLSPPRASREPTLRFMLSHPAHVIALAGGCGLSAIAPGTVGTLWAWLAFALLDPLLSDFQWGVLIAAGVPIACWAGMVTARNLGTTDPAPVVIDEVLSFWCVLWLVMPADLWSQAAAFVLFRFYDAVKPGPIGWADRCFKLRRGAPIGWAQGFGILFDDAVATLVTLLTIAMVQRVWSW